MLKRILLVGMILIAAVSFAAQTGTIKTDEFHFVSLEGNLVGDPPKRSVIVYLPPYYEKQKKMRYPVVYLLHGYGASVTGNKMWVPEGGTFVEPTSRLITEKKISPMIQDGLLEANRQFRDALKRNGIEHTYEQFEGGHTDKTRERIATKMLPLMSHLGFSEFDG